MAARENEVPDICPISTDLPDRSAGSSPGPATPETGRSVLFDADPGSELGLSGNKFDKALDLAGSNVETGFDNLADGDYVMVMGGLGYIGSHTTVELARAGYNVVVVDDMSNSFVSVLENVKLLAKQESSRPTDIRYFRADYRDQTAIAALLTRFVVADQPKPTSRICGVIHFAAFKSVEESISRPLDYYQNNVCGLVGLVGQLARFGIFNLVFSSSATVYGTVANRGRPLREHNMVHRRADVEVGPDDAVNQSGRPSVTSATIEPGATGITSPYGRTKYMCEAILADVAGADDRWQITLLRYFNPVGCHRSGLLGEHPRQRPTNLVPVLIQVLTGERDQVEIFGDDYDTPDGTAVRDFIHVEDLARGHIAAVKAAGNPNRNESKPGQTNNLHVYNLGTGSGHTVKQVVAAIEAASGRKIRATTVGRRDGDVGFCVAAVDRAENDLDWKAVRSLDECARDVWNYTVRSGRVRSVDQVEKTVKKQSEMMMMSQSDTLYTTARPLIV